MPLIDELNITLKDLLPAAADRRVVADRAGTAAVVSADLFARLSSYASTRHVPLVVVIDQLRDELHRR